MKQIATAAALLALEVVGIDAGGTMTDTFYVREDGSFVVGKAQSNPGDESSIEGVHYAS